MTWAALAALTVLLGAAFAACWPLLGRLDNQLGGDDVLLDPRTGFRDRARQWLGLDHIDDTLRRIEDTMAQVIDLLNALVAQNTAASAAQATSFHNIDAAIAKLQAAVAAQGEATPEVQAAVDQLSAGFAALQKSAEDEGRPYLPTDDNGGDVPPPADDTNPPADGGDTPVDNGGDVTPAADDTDQPAARSSRK